MRICYLAEAPSVHVQRWAAWFARRGHQVHLVSLTYREVPGVQVYRFPPGGTIAFPNKIFALRRIVRSIEPDLLHAHQVVGYGLWGALAGFHPFVVSAWGSDVLVRPVESWTQALVLRYVLRRADFCIPVAHHLQAKLKDFGLRVELSEAIPMGVDLTVHSVFGYRRSSRFPAFLSTRSLEPIYDVATVVRASRWIFEANPEVRATIVGDGSRRSELEALARELRVDDRLKFCGRLPPETIFARLRETPVYVSASKSDGTSVSLLEAMSQGCFPVVSDIPANREWIMPGENGLLFPVGDAKGLASSVLEALDDESLLERAARLNIKLVAERGDLNLNLRRVERLYERILRP